MMKQNSKLGRSLLNGSLALMLLGLAACSTTTPTPVVTVVEKTVVVVVTATNPPVTATPTLVPASATPAATATLAPSATPASTNTPSPEPVTPTLAETLTPTKAPTRTPGVLPTLVPAVRVTLTGIFPGSVRYLPVASTEMNVQYFANQIAGGPIVSNIFFDIYSGSQHVFSSSDNKFPYCAFGDDGKTCSSLVFDDYVYTWPGNHISVVTGDYVLRVTVKDNSSPVDSWSLDIPFKIRVP